MLPRPTKSARRWWVALGVRLHLAYRGSGRPFQHFLVVTRLHTLRLTDLRAEARCSHSSAMTYSSRLKRRGNNNEVRAVVRLHRNGLRSVERAAFSVILREFAPMISPPASTFGLGLSNHLLGVHLCFHMPRCVTGVSAAAMSRRVYLHALSLYFRFLHLHLTYILVVA